MCALSVPATDLQSTNLYHRCIWREYNNWVTSGLTDFSRSRGQNVKIERMVNQGDTNNKCCTQRLVILHMQMCRRTNEPWLHTKNQLSLAYFTDQNTKNYPKVCENVHFCANWALQSTCCLLFWMSHWWCWQRQLANIYPEKLVLHRACLSSMMGLYMNSEVIFFISIIV